MKDTRIELYPDAETARRIEIAAARRHQNVAEYCLAAVEFRLADEGLSQGEDGAAVTHSQRNGLIAGLRALHEQILAENGGRLIDVDTLIEDLREERDNDVLGLR